MNPDISRRAMLSALLMTVGCARPANQELLVADESGMPYLTKGPDGRIHLSWVDYLSDGGHALRTASWDGRRWSQPETIASGQRWFVNWADAPSIAVMPSGAMFAHWLSRGAESGKYGYGIRIAHKSASGGAWHEVHGINLEDKVDYAGFLRFAPDAPFAVYLSPPAKEATESALSHEQHDAQATAAENPHEDGHRKTFRLVEFDEDGGFIRDREVDSDVCSCCPTAVGRSNDGWIAAYRDRRAGEIRDISVIRFDGKSWSQPQNLHADGWEIHGCPTEGPSIASIDKDVAIAWLTRANERARIQYVISHDGGASFGDAVLLDDGSPLGRPQLVPLDAESFLAAWLEKSESSHLDIRIRRIHRDGTRGASTTVAKAPAGRAAGLPRIIVHDDEIVLAWRDQRVQTQHLSVSQFLGKAS
jgi:hypothetical protein